MYLLDMKNIMAEKKTILVVLLIRLTYAGYFFLTKLAFDLGMNTLVFVFYRQAAATLFLIPFAMFFERNTAPQLSFSILIKIFLLSLFGITASLDLVGVGLKYTTASLGAATTNTIPVITFFLAVIFRMEKMDMRTSPGIMKLIGVSLCIGGSALIAFYKGPIFKLLLHNHLINGNHFKQINSKDGASSSSNTWIKGVSLVFLSNVAWACWLVLQGRVLKHYPSKLRLTIIQCFLSTIQSGLVALAFTRDPIQWRLQWNISLLSIFYCGIVVTGITFYLQAWVVEKKGPVYLAMTTPLIFVFTILLSSFIFGEIISLGSVLGAVILVGGLYFVLWAKTKEEETTKATITNDAEKAAGE